MKLLITSLALLLFTFAVLPVTLDAYESDPPPHEEKGFETYFREGIERIKAREYEKAIAAFTKAIELNPLESAAYYNIACCYSLMEKKAEALEWLQRAVENGWDDFEHTEQDADLANIRAEPAYLKIIADMRAAAGLNCGFYAMYVPEKCTPDKEWPLLIGLHGYGSNAADYLKLWQPVADAFGIIVACPQGSVRIKKKSYGWNLEAAEKAILACLSDVPKRAKIDLKRVYLNGFSQGGALAYMIGLKHCDRFAGLLPVAAFYDAEKNKPNLARAGEKKLAVYIVQGTQDAHTLEPARQAEKEMTAAGLRVKLAEYPVGHAFPEEYPQEFVKALEWLEGEK